MQLTCDVDTRCLGFVHLIFLKGRFGKFICSCPSGKMDGQLTSRLGLTEGSVVSHAGCSVTKNSLPVVPRWVSAFPPFRLSMGGNGYIFRNAVFQMRSDGQSP